MTAFVAATVRSATPLAAAALGELVAERAGIINIGLEGIVLGGAFGALVGASAGGVSLGFACAVAAGLALAGVFAIFAVQLGADQIITGTAITLFAVGLTGTLYRAMYGARGVALSVPTSGPVPLGALAHAAWIGPIFAQPAITYAVYLLVPSLWCWMYRSQAGLAVRAVGENPAAARVTGIDTKRVRFAAVLFSGACGGAAGAILVLTQAGTFAEGMSAGRGFIAIAIVVLGRWHPVGVAVAALVFGAASALQFLFQAAGYDLPYQLFLAVPYVLTLAALAGAGGRTDAPAALGRTEAA